MKFYIGTSGYSYAHWGQGIFYPKGLPPSQWLEYYCRHFNSVELNVTFYRLPQKETFQEWYHRTPKEFRFVVKGARFITHIKRLHDVKESLLRLAETIAPLKSKIECLLWQLPPNFKKDEQRLKTFCQQLRKIKILNTTHHAFEFRERSWFHEDVYSVLREFRYCLCLFDSPQIKADEILTCPYVYLRYHGSSTRYASNYSQDELKHWINKMRALKNRIHTIYAFFNNDFRGYAVFNATSFREILLNSFSRAKKRRSIISVGF